MALAAWVALAWPLGASAAVFYSTGSGAWEAPGLWSTRGASDDEDGVPDGDDEVFVLAGHEVVFSRVDAAPSAAVINVYGVLRLPEARDQREAARLWTRRVLVRGGGRFEALGPHTILLEGGEGSQVGVQRGGALRLRGSVEVHSGALSGVLREGAAALVLEDQSQAWAPGALVGKVLKLLSGRGRLWSFQIVANTATTVTLLPGSLGSPPGPVSFVAAPGADPRALQAEGALVDMSARPYKDGLLRGMWLRRGDEGALRYITGVVEGEGVDQVLVWPPVEGGEAARWTTSYGIGAGDAYTIYDPVQVTIPEERRLPARPTTPWGVMLYLSERTQSEVEHVSLSYGFVQIEGLDLTQPESALSMSFVDVAHADPGCFFLARGVRGLSLRQLHLRDVHPDSDTVEFGGRWRADQQRGHGLCVYGREVEVRDNLVTNVNDDMLYFSQIGEAVIEGNVAINGGIFHGNSFENITLFRVLGDVTLRRNVAMNAKSQVLIEERVVGAEVVVEDNILSQEQARGIINDRGPAEAGEVEWRNNALFGPPGALAMAVLGGHPSRLEGNFLVHVGLDGPLEAERNVLLDLGSGRQPLLINPGVFEENVLARRGQPRGGALALLREPSPAAGGALLRNTLVAGEGAALRILGRSAAPERRFDVAYNLSDGNMLEARGGEPAPGQWGLRVRENVSSGPLWGQGAPGWLSGYVEASNQEGSPAWSEAERYVLVEGEGANAAADGGRVGAQGAGLRWPARLAVPLEGLWSQPEGAGARPGGGGVWGGRGPAEEAPEPGPGEAARAPGAYAAGGCGCAMASARGGGWWSWWLRGGRRGAGRWGR